MRKEQNDKKPTVNGIGKVQLSGNPVSGADGMLLPIEVLSPHLFQLALMCRIRQVASLEKSTFQVSFVSTLDDHVSRWKYHFCSLGILKHLFLAYVVD